MGLEKKLFQYLKQCNIEVSENYVEQRIKSHPGYPAFMSIADTFKELGIDFKVIKCTEKDNTQLNYPFLAGVNSPQTFEIVLSAEYIKSNRDFLRNWNGIVLMVKPDQIIQDIGHNIVLQKERDTKRNVAIGLIMGFVLYTVINLVYFKLFFFLLSSLSICGILVSYLIVLQITKTGNSFTEWFCRPKSHNCNLVLHSKPTKIIKNVHPGEIGLIYFSALLLFSLFNLVGELTVSSLLIPFFVADCIAMFSIWYQWRVIRVWCAMCLFVAGVIGLQTFVLIPNLSYEYTPKFTELLPSLVLLGMSLLLGSFWLYLKQFLLNAKDKISKDIEALRWKRNPFIFQSLLYSQKRIINTYFDGQLVVGNRNAPLKFIIVAAPYSSASAEVFFQMKDLYKLYPELISFSVVFRIKADNKSDRRTIAAEHIISAALSENNKIGLLNDWFATMEIDPFLSKYPGAAYSTQVDHVLALHQSLASYNIYRTVPAVFLNGFRMPVQYTIDDLKYMRLNSNLINNIQVSNSNIKAGI